MEKINGFMLGTAATLVLGAGAIPFDSSAEPLAPGATGLVASIDKAPVTPDGNVTGRPADFVITLDGSLDPQSAGRSLATGDSIRVFLPPEFDLGNIDAAYPVAELPVPGSCTPGNLNCTTGVLLRGWPQDPFFPPAANHSFSVDVPSNSIIYTAKQDLGGVPGIKQVHLILHGVTNPAPGAYRIRVEADTGPGGALETGEGVFHVLPEVKPSINVTSVFVTALDSGACGPGTLPPNPINPIYQSTSPGADAPFVWTFLLWGENGIALSDVAIKRVGQDQWQIMRNESGGNGRGVPRANGLLGTITIEAPAGASGQSVRLNNDAGLGCPTWLPAAPVIGPTPGIGPQPVGRLDLVFTAGDAAGVYKTTLSLRDGNSATMVVVAD